MRLRVGSEEVSRTDTKQDDCPIEVHEKSVNVHERRDEQPINFTINQMSNINVCNAKVGNIFHYCNIKNMLYKNSCFFS